MNRTFSESLRFPAVEKPARVVVKKRDAKNAFQPILDAHRRSGRQVHHPWRIALPGRRADAPPRGRAIRRASSIC